MNMQDAAMQMLAKDRSDLRKQGAHAYVTLAAVARREQREDCEATYADTRPRGAHKFKTGERMANMDWRRLRRKPNRAERQARRGQAD